MQCFRRIATFSAAVVLLACVSNTLGRSETKSKFFEASDGTKIHYLEAGKGKTILFVPGIMVPAEVWEPQIEHFSKDYRVIAMDPRSQGRSEKVTEGHFSARRGKDIGELAAHVSDEPVILVAWSLAVWETLKFIKEHGPDRFRAIVLVDMWIGFDSRKPEPHPITPAVASFIEGLQENRAEWTKQWIRSFFVQPPPEAFIEKLAKQVMKTPTNTAVSLYANTLLVDDRDYRPVIDHLKIPVMMIMSTSEMAEVVTKDSRSRWPSMRIETIPETRHALFMEKPEEFNSILRRFISELPE